MEYDLKTNPNKWTDYFSAQRPLTMNIIGLYIIVMIVLQGCTFVAFLLENFHNEIWSKFTVSFTSLKSYRPKIRCYRPKIRNKLLLSLKCTVLTLILCEGFISLWAISQYGKFHGFPFGKAFHQIRKFLTSASRRSMSPNSC